ncbi:putative transporter YwbF [Brevibacillus agri]|uniref:MFS transporter n=1 Tax=Brevibacillus agri TaxID=51101 RepID=A0A3M8B9A8_9BACL|nr:MULTISPECIES: MFS transporter [Brevibacillus]EJL47721.1 arabinose efflux permease family protein [Brevibacillus sp. CF112]MBG9568561.1 MFS transporter [Brevibacillus agri]MCG5253728.1 MFS transporter [Brevibacillus agri]MDN4094639.1 MFS transporter [Brevibacillus agri]MDR9504406.1 MFS transporter [Brevibacillus agri]
MNTAILSLRAYNFFYFSLLSIFISFLPVYLTYRGITPAQIGVLIGAGSFIGILSQPFWGMMSDRYKTIRRIILLTLGLSIAAGVLLFTSASFFALFLLVGAMYFFLLPTDPLTESLNYRIAELHGTSFGSIRTFGAVGYATASLFIGWTLDRLGMGQLVWLFVGYGVFAYACALVMQDAPASSKSLSWQELKQFFLYPQTQRFFLLVLIAATPHRTNDSFLGVYVQSLGGTTGDVGQAWFLAAVSEVAFFAISARLLARWSELRLIMLASALYAIRYVLCAIAPSAEWVVYLQLTQGVTFVLFYTATIQYLYKIIPEEWKATGQTVLAVLFFGISGIIGSLVGGWLFQQGGGAALYWAMGICSAAAFVYSLILARAGKAAGGLGL